MNLLKLARVFDVLKLILRRLATCDVVALLRTCREFAHNPRLRAYVGKLRKRATQRAKRNITFVSNYYIIDISFANDTNAMNAARGDVIMPAMLVPHYVKLGNKNARQRKKSREYVTWLAAQYK